MHLNDQQARHLEGKLIHFQNQKGDWRIGRVAKVRKDGIEIEELIPSRSEGFGYGFWGGGPFFRPPVFFPFIGFAFSPFFFW